MPVWPKSFHTLGVHLATARTDRQLRRGGDSARQQEQAFTDLTTQLAATSYWRQLGIEARMPYAKFRSGVPLFTYEAIAPAIERMKRGEGDVLWPGRCTLFALSSGTTTGRPKYVPMTEPMLQHLRKAGTQALLYYTARTKNAGVFRGRHLWLGGVTRLTPIDADNPQTTFAGELSAIAALNLPGWVEKHLYEPGTSVAATPDWDARLQAIAGRTCQRDITLLGGIPNWILLLGAIVRDACPVNGARAPNLQALWPNFECFVHTGIPVAPFMAALRVVLGPTVAFHEVYATVEGCIAAQDDVAAKGLRLMAETGLFFEFLPMSEFDPAGVAQLGPKAVPLGDVKTGVDYALVVTTPAGLARYLPGDVVRFVSTEPHRIVHIGNTTQRLHAFGENVTEKEVTEALTRVCERHGWTIVNFHVALNALGNLPSGEKRGRHEWWIELKPGTVATPMGPPIAAELDVELQHANPDYRTRRRKNVLELPVVRLVMPGVFEHWLRHQDRWGGQHKLARCRSDRLHADPLAQLTNFARD